MKTNLMKMKFALTMAGLALLSGSLAHAEPGFDVNDLNILFATGADGKLVPEIPLFPVDPKGNVLPDKLLATSLFVDVQREAKALGIGTAPSDAEKAALSAPDLFFHVGADKKQWRVVALRYDSCFPAVPKDETEGTKNCIEHVRLIAQPISARRGNGEDTTMHLLYAVNGVVGADGKTIVGPVPGKTLTIIDQLKQLKAQAGVVTNGTPLGVHPALSTAQTQVNFANQVKAFIDRNCNTSKLMVITYMGLQGRGPEPWIFFGGNANVAAGGGPGRWKVDFQPTTGPTLDAQGKAQAGSDAIVFSNINQPSGDPAKPGKVSPHPHSFFIDKALSEGSNEDVAGLFEVPAASLTQPQFQTLKDMANLVERPRIHAPHNTDCFSCHATNTQARINNIPPSIDGKTFVVADGVTAYVDRDVQPSTSWNTRNFGYFGGKPSVSYLTAQSAGDVTAFTNHQLKLDMVGIKCGNDAKKQVALRICTMFGVTAPGAAAGTQLPFLPTAASPANCVQQAGCTR